MRRSLQECRPVTHHEVSSFSRPASTTGMTKARNRRYSGGAWRRRVMAPDTAMAQAATAQAATVAGVAVAATAQAATAAAAVLTLASA